MTDHAPSSGEIWWVDFSSLMLGDLVHEHSGDRPVVVMTSGLVSQRLKTTAVIPCTTEPSRRSTQLWVEPPMWVRVCDSDGHNYGWALPSQVTTVSLVRLRRRVGHVPDGLRLKLTVAVLQLWGICPAERGLEILEG